MYNYNCGMSKFSFFVHCWHGTQFLRYMFAGVGWKYKSNIDQSYQQYGAYFDHAKKKLEFQHQPRDKVKAIKKTRKENCQHFARQRYFYRSSQRGMFRKMLGMALYYLSILF